jgi:hypothetical protein
MAKVRKASNNSGDFSNDPIEEEDEDELPNRRPDLADSYEEDFDDMSNKEGYKSPAETLSGGGDKIRESKIMKNASMGNLQSLSKYARIYI